jgi:hypothetical protein
MAGSTFCVSCASLPVKDGSAAIKRVQCPDCQTTFGVTSYGTPFRIDATKRRLLSPMFVSGMVVGAALFTFVVILVGLGVWSRDRIAGPIHNPVRAVKAADLARVPEVAVDERFPAKVQSQVAKQRIASLVAQIRTANNGVDKDAFVLARIKERPELAGLPFIMGDACRLNGQQAPNFERSVQAVREGMDRDSHVRDQKNHAAFWSTYFISDPQRLDSDHGVRALTQILGPEHLSYRLELVQNLKRSNRTEATTAIARAAVFDPDGDVRVAAIKALKETNKQHAGEVTEILRQGIRYPLATVAWHTAQAMIALDRKDLVADLAAVLGDPIPGDPEERQAPDGTETHVVREVVKINHHRNCLLCHPPSQTGNIKEVPGVIPIPGIPFPTSPKEAYGQAQSSGEPMVRADTTYLRQDFSVMMPVENAAPWPEMQRFDFLVRTRPVTGKELTVLQEKVKARPAGHLSEHQKAAVQALTRLSGHENVAPTQAAWQRVLGVAGADD